MIDIGNFFLAAAALLSVYALIVGSIGAQKRNPQLVRSAREALLIGSFSGAAALFALMKAFLVHDYRYVYVWQTSNNAMPPMYLISAVWGGMDGSMLLWAVFVGMFASILMVRISKVGGLLAAWLVPTAAGSVSFFFVVVLLFTNPFKTVPVGTVLTDGNGLNPLLQNPSMLIHPPFLYLGFTGLMIPAAFCIAALLSGELGSRWLRLTRRWTLIAWSFLTVGIFLGGHWAYIELGWGGFWAWDPVENASFLPWLTATAFLHSVMVQERRGMLKQWNVWLSVGTYLLCVFGTFLTRSGIVQSVHAFAETDIGWVFLLYIGVVFVITAILVYSRRSELKSEGAIESFFSREAIFLLNNVLLLGVCFATLWGVMFPVISEYFTGEQSVVGPPFFNAVNVPLFIAVLFFMGVGPLIAWKRTSGRALFRIFIKPFIAGSLFFLLCLWLDPTRIWTAVCFATSLFVIAALGAEFHRAAKVRQQLSSGTIAKSAVVLLRTKPERYGGLLVHLGVVVVAISIAGSMGYKIERDVALLPGEEIQVGAYTFKLDAIDETRWPNYQALIAKMSVYDAERALLMELQPERRFYFASEQATTEVAYRTSLKEDVYVAFAGMEDLDSLSGGSKPKATFKIFINPLQIWLWFGGLVMLGGTFVVLRPRSMFRELLRTEDAIQKRQVLS